MSDQAQRFTHELQALYAAAGSPRYSAIVAHGARQVQPVRFRDATLSDWLTRGSVPSSASAFAALTELLEHLASRHSGHVRRSGVEWEQLRAAARAGRNAGPANHRTVRMPSDDRRAATVLGTPIGQCNPLDLEVHAAGNLPSRDAGAVLPGYAPRAHDEQLAAVVAQAAAGRSAMAVLIGSSSTGKTRACWEAVQPLAQAEPEWRLWHPYDPTRADAALAGLAAVGPRTVIWLNEAQHYLGAGEQLAAALHAVLTDPDRAPVLVLGTLWPEYDAEYATRPAGGRDQYARVRELLAGRRIWVPETFDATALTTVRGLAERGDRLLAAVLGHSHEGHIAQHLAGAPELLTRYYGASAGARALLHAAVDARRLGVNLHLPLTFLTGAAPDYLNADAYDALTEDWLKRALDELAKPVHGNFAPLRLIRKRLDHRPPGATPTPPHAPVPAGPLYRLADYLEQHGRHERRLVCPPASFWHAAWAHLTGADDLRHLALAARKRSRLYWAERLDQRAADAGNPDALCDLAWTREWAGDWVSAEDLRQRAADAGSSWALLHLVRIRERAGDRVGAEAAFQRAYETEDNGVLCALAQMRQQAGDQSSAEDLLRRAINTGSTEALRQLGWMWHQAGERARAEDVFRHAADAGNTDALCELAWMREETGDQAGAKDLYQRAADAGDKNALLPLARMRQRAGDRTGAEELHRRFFYGGSIDGLALEREMAGDWAGAKELYQRIADAGSTFGQLSLGRLQKKAGDWAGAEILFQRVADAGNSLGLIYLAEMRKEAGDLAGAERLYQRVVDAGDPDGLKYLSRMRKEAGDQAGAAHLQRYGLEPDGAPASPWSWP